MGSVLALAGADDLSGADPEGDRAFRDDGPDREVLIFEGVPHVPEQRVGGALGGLRVVGDGDRVLEAERLPVGESLERRDDRLFVVGERLRLATCAGTGDGGDLGGLNLECHLGRPFNLRWSRSPPTP